MKDSKGNEYDGWAIAWGRAGGETHISWYVMSYTRTLCIQKYMEYWPGKTWRQIRRRNNIRCIKVRLVEV